MSCIVAPTMATCSQQQSLGLASGAMAALTLGLYWRFMRLEAGRTLWPLRRVLVLSHRIALVIPSFSLIAIVAFIVPQGLPVLASAQGLAEGAALWSFFKMIIHAVGPDDECTRLMKESPAVGCLVIKYPVWRRCQSSTLCLGVMRATFLQFFLLRPVLMLVEGAFEINYLETKRKESQTLSSIFNALAIISLAITLPAIVRAYEIFGRLMPELGCLKKVIFVKAFIFIWVVQNNAVRLFPSSDTALVAFLRLRIFSFVVLVELAVLSIALPFIFGSSDSLLNKARALCRATADSPHSSEEALPSATTLLAEIVSLKYSFDPNKASPALSLFPGLFVVDEIDSPLQQQQQEQEQEQEQEQQRASLSPSSAPLTPPTPPPRAEQV